MLFLKVWLGPAFQLHLACGNLHITHTRPRHCPPWLCPDGFLHWEGLSHHHLCNSTHMGCRPHLPGRPSLITSSSTLSVPLLHCQPSLPCGRLGCVRQPHNNHMPLQGPSWGRLPERLTQYVCSCLWTVLSHPKIHSGFIQITF